jgi:hypothetical protein
VANIAIINIVSRYGGGIRKTPVLPCGMEISQVLMASDFLMDVGDNLIDVPITA